MEEELELPWPQPVVDMWDMCLQKSERSKGQLWTSMLKYYCKLHRIDGIMTRGSTNVLDIIEPCFNKCNTTPEEFTNTFLKWADEDDRIFYENQRIACEWGTEISRCNMPTHLKSNKHFRLMTKKYRMGLLN